MQSKQRRRFLSYGTALIGSGWLAACGDGTGNSGAASGRAIADMQEPGVVPATPPGNLVASREITGHWRFASVSDYPYLSGAQLASADGVSGMAAATVPGTALNSMIVNGRYPDPFYGRIVTDTIPDTLKDTDYWYRTAFATPALRPGQRLWLRFDGVNYMAAIWLNGTPVGTLEGAFRHGYFDVTKLVAAAGGTAYLAVRVIKLDFSEGPLKPSYSSGVTRGGHNGGPTGVTLKNGPTFFCAAGWDWLPTIPDRDLGIWQPVSWFTTGTVRIADLHVDSTLSDDLGSARLQLDLSLDNRTGAPLAATVTGRIGNGIVFSHAITIPAADHPTTTTLTSADVSALSLSNPKLWWPNGYGEPNLYAVTVSIEVQGQVSDTRTINVGLRRIEYSRDIGFGSQLSIKVNKLPILVMGGNWGLDDALKRIPRERLFNQVRLHRDANLNLIRNWNGQSTSRDFFDACDAYGILVWQEFFYSTEAGGAGPANVPRDLANIRDIIVHYRNHPSILLWCGGNEGSPPTALVNGVDALVKELDPGRLCLTSSASDTGDGAVNGYSSGGPYHWESPKGIFSRGYGTSNTAFHNEVGSYSIPTLEFVQAMLPSSSWECPDDYWADRDINADGYQSIYLDGWTLRWGGDGYIARTRNRYGQPKNLADFVRKSQMMNYESIKAIYEATAAVMIGPASGNIASPATGVIMWMTNPAQPSFIWQMYSHDLEQHSSFFAVQRACRRINVILDANTFNVTIANHDASAVFGSVDMRVYNLDSTLAGSTVQDVGVAPASHQVVANLGAQIAAATSDVCIVALALRNPGGATVADNLYWCQKNGQDASYESLDTIAAASIAVSASLVEANDTTTRITADVENIGKAISLMTHLQLYDQSSGQRILPAFYSDNYLNLLPGTSTQIVIDVPHAKEKPISGVALRVDGWKLDQRNTRLSSSDVPVTFNQPALTVAPAVATFGKCGSS
ncbi:MULTISPECIES: sugar-binding domain-containing protein [Paraburkholderia]|uniref:glycoside hydrolase family 2 protein n=1 Tax=Paraburkholderia TaxID=1822464 RepID=UPI0022570F86|nr:MULTISPECIES: sugar-binding domain-containing protein [Paraburkholderia]MCX4160911.1 beta-galactosidase [Paraburkholderia megapolitana]MDN7156407.1 beta-galactosidase [Paraburkholderia sp. CHISQ3]MDQ6493452.1 beta-galactosidase [Paraburkholderia megapolitana]